MYSLSLRVKNLKIIANGPMYFQPNGLCHRTPQSGNDTKKSKMSKFEVQTVSLRINQVLHDSINNYFIKICHNSMAMLGLLSNSTCKLHF